MKLVNCTKCHVSLELVDGNLMQAIDKSSYLCKPCYKLLNECLHECYLQFIQPERSKREDSYCCQNQEKRTEIWKRICVLRRFNQKNRGKLFGYSSEWLQELKQYEMRCSEHCGNTVRDK